MAKPAKISSSRGRLPIGRLQFPTFLGVSVSVGRCACLLSHSQTETSDPNHEEIRDRLVVEYVPRLVELQGKDHRHRLRFPAWDSERFFPSISARAKKLSNRRNILRLTTKGLSKLLRGHADWSRGKVQTKLFC